MHSNIEYSIFILFEVETLKKIDINLIFLSWKVVKLQGFLLKNSVFH